MEFTAEGANISPPLAWSGEPAHTKTFGLIVEDWDDQGAVATDPSSARTRWLLYNIPSTLHALPQAAQAGGLPAGVVCGLNAAGRADYDGPTATDKPHRYSFRLFALDAVLTTHPRSKAQLEEAMAGHVIDRAELVGTYAARTT